MVGGLSFSLAAYTLSVRSQPSSSASTSLVAPACCQLMCVPYVFVTCCRFSSWSSRPKARNSSGAKQQQQAAANGQDHKRKQEEGAGGAAAAVQQQQPVLKQQRLERPGKLEGASAAMVVGMQVRRLLAGRGGTQSTCCGTCVLHHSMQSGRHNSACTSTLLQGSNSFCRISRSALQWLGLHLRCLQETYGMRPHSDTQQAAEFRRELKEMRDEYAQVQQAQQAQAQVQQQAQQAQQQQQAQAQAQQQQPLPEVAEEELDSLYE